MEIIILSLSFSFILTVILVCVTFLLYRRDEAPVPPGKTGWPIVGETLEFLRVTRSSIPEKFTWERMEKFSAKVFKTSFLNENVAVFCGASGNKFVFTNTKELNRCEQKGNSKLLFAQENIDNLTSRVQLRKITQQFLSPELIEKHLVKEMDQIAKQHFETHGTSQQVLFLEFAKKYTFSLACHLFLSLTDPEKVDFLEKLFKDIIQGLTAIPINFPGTTFHRALKSSYTIRKEIMLIVKQRKLQMLSKDSTSNVDSKKLDMMSQIWDSESGELPRDSLIVDMIVACLVAGHDTTTSTITCMVKYLTELPHVYAQVLQEQMEIAKKKKPGELLNASDIKKMKYTWCVVNETMRLAPPVQGTFRNVVQDVNYAGFTIPKGWKAYWTVNSTHKISKYFKNPEEFDPTRFEESGPRPYTFVPFGGGRFICPGQQYAKNAILAFIHNFITQFDFEKILPNEKVTYLIGPVPVSGLPIRLSSRTGQIN